MNVVAIIQARVTSTRLPGKVLLDIAGRPMLARVVERVRRAQTVDRVLVATSVDPSDDLLAGWCAETGVACCRGSLDDVLDRYYEAAKAESADVIVRITSDCPLIDPAVIDEVVRAYRDRAGLIEYASNVVPMRTFPRGLDVEVFSAAALERGWREATDPRWREHVTPFLYLQPETYRTFCLTHSRDFSNHRWTVDTAEDLELVRRVYGDSGTDEFGWSEVLAVLDRHPDWIGLNHHVEQKKL